nr:TIM barrel protein [Saccharopolyspora sp. HNM0983]
MFTELPVERRPAAARAAGFDAVESWWPFDRPVPGDAEVDRFVRSITDAGVSLVVLNFYAGDMPAGERGVLSDPARAREFTDNADVVAGIGERLGCRLFNALHGTRTGGTPEQQDELAVRSLRYAAEAVGRIGGQVLLEPLSGVPGYPLRTAAEAMALVERVRATGLDGRLGLLFDLYHLVVNEDDPRAALQRWSADIGHVQIADAPGRHEPGTGGIDFAEFFAQLDAVGYPGRIGLEYLPTGASADGFGWLQHVPAGGRAR